MSERYRTSLDADPIGGAISLLIQNHEFGGALICLAKSSPAIGPLNDGDEDIARFCGRADVCDQLARPRERRRGMVGVQRGVDVTSSRSLKTKAFDDILFPENPVADAPRIINELRCSSRSVRSLTIGPMIDVVGSPRIHSSRRGAVPGQRCLSSPAQRVVIGADVLVGQLRLELLAPARQIHPAS